MRHPVSTPLWSRYAEALSRPVVADRIGRGRLPTPPQDAEPSPGQDAYGVGVIAAACLGALINLGGPRRGPTGVVGKDRDGSPEALVAGPAEGDSAVFARLHRDGDDAGFRGESLHRREAQPLLAQFGEDLGRVGAAGPWERHDDRAIRMDSHRLRDGTREFLNLGDEVDQDGDQGANSFTGGLRVRLAHDDGRGAAQPLEQFARGAAATVAVAAEEGREPLFAEMLGASGVG